MKRRNWLKMPRRYRVFADWAAKRSKNNRIADCVCVERVLIRLNLLGCREMAVTESFYEIEYKKKGDDYEF